MRFHLVRHGQTPANVQGRIQGQSGTEALTALGRAQAVQAGVTLDRLGLTGPVFSSDLPRAAETAGIIANQLGADIWFDDRAREQHYGSMESVLRTELRAQPTPLGRHVSEVHWGGGESVAELYARVHDLLLDLRRLAHDAAASDIILVSHSGPIRAALVVLDQFAQPGRQNPHRLVQWHPIANGEVLTRSL